MPMGQFNHSQISFRKDQSRVCFRRATINARFGTFVIALIALIVELIKLHDQRKK